LGVIDASDWVRCQGHSRQGPPSLNADAELEKGHPGDKIPRVPDRLDSPTDLLLAWGRGEAGAFDRLVPLVHDELRWLARQYMRRERPDHTLQATALVNEVYVRLIAASRVEWQNRAHFFAIAARAMRQILVDFARRRRASQRGGGWQQVALDEDLMPSSVRHPDLVALDEALKRLELVHPRKSQVVELRYFGGMKVEEAATVLGVSRDTVKRDWRFAKLWLLRELDAGTRRASARAQPHGG
jgi:RNA polymerase sigma factor (TIGR02999 family)